jgi:predicted small lipoprotein YifL
MKKIITTAALSLAVLSLAACGQSAGTTDSPEEVVPVDSSPKAVAPVETPEPEPTEDEKTSDRGNLIMKVKETGVVSDGSTGDELMQFTVKSIKPVECTEQYWDGVENGHMYAVDLSAVTTKNLEEGMANFSSYAFTYFSEEGTRFNGDLGAMSTYSCLPESEMVPSMIGPGEKVTGKIVLDLPAESGTLVFAPSYDSGFEYTY